MSIWKSTLITGGALGSLLMLGTVNTATAGQGYYGGDSASAYKHYPDGSGSKPGCFSHPIYGHTFKHPVYGYKFKHPVQGYVPMRRAVHNLGSGSMPLS